MALECPLDSILIIAKEIFSDNITHCSTEVFSDKITEVHIAFYMSFAQYITLQIIHNKIMKYAKKFLEVYATK